MALGFVSQLYPVNLPPEIFKAICRDVLGIWDPEIKILPYRYKNSYLIWDGTEIYPDIVKFIPNIEIYDAGYHNKFFMLSIEISSVSNLDVLRKLVFDSKIYRYQNCYAVEVDKEGSDTLDSLEHLWKNNG